ncbi:FMN-binding negative transcriptional regulator [Massilia sp. CMS3.1]|uniref:FMN-binding negative transcriptional regulator n=1 Tax=Massilia sp. CMS3.1 TaxID=3373083 RepID=UPI003EE438C3
MYVRQDHRFTDVDAQYALIEDHALGAWVIHSEDGLVANHVPFLLERSRGPHGTLVGHVARANPVWRALDTATASLVMFQGPQSYITPSWYPGKAEHGKVVPTWDYAVVHAHGVARAIEDPAWLMDMLERLTNANEAAQPAPWRVKDAPADYIDKLLRAIVGIEIPIARLEGKLKASQDEAVRDRLGTVEGLRGLLRPKAAMADLVLTALEGERKGQP